MRLIMSLGVGALALTSLAACNRQSDDSVRANFRSMALAGCRQGGDPATRAQMSQVGINIDELCTCAIDRYMSSAPIDQLRGNPTPQALQSVQAASMQCAQEMVSRAGAAPGATPGTPPGANAAPAAPEAPALPAEPGAGEENSAE